jgi:hypothetical protein
MKPKKSKPEIFTREEQGLIWDYFKPRHTHAWNMLVLSWRDLDQLNEEDGGFESEYHWENFIIRLWLYRTTVLTLTKLNAVEGKAKIGVKTFDDVFIVNDGNGLKALRDMIEHFDDYAAGVGRGPATRERDLDPWRLVSRDRYERGLYCLERSKSYDAALRLRANAKCVSDEFTHWYNSLE